MARENPTRPSVVPPDHPIGDDGRPRPEAGLTPSQVHALRRSAPLSPARFKELRRLADQGVTPLRHL